MRTPKVPRLRDGTRNFRKVQKLLAEIRQSDFQFVSAISTANVAHPRCSPARHLLQLFRVSSSLHLDF